MKFKVFLHQASQTQISVQKCHTEYSCIEFCKCFCLAEHVNGQTYRVCKHLARN